MQNNNLRNLTDIEQPLDHVKFSEHSEKEIHLATLILLRQNVRESQRIRKRISYILVLVLILIITLALLVLNESIF